MNRYGTTPERFLLIGDEIRDIEAARKAGVHIGAVAWGYNHIDALRARCPHQVFLTVDDLARTLTLESTP
jgi:phosphoglycolate phosphatase